MRYDWPDEAIAALKQCNKLSNTEAASLLCKQGYSITPGMVAGKRRRLGLSAETTGRVKLLAAPKKPKVKISPWNRNDPNAKKTGWQPAPEDSATAKPLLELAENECRWPIAEDLFCGAKFTPQRGRKPYCETHSKR